MTLRASSRRCGAWLPVVTAALAWSSVSVAQDLQSTLDQGVREVAHQVSVVLHDGYAQVTERRAFVGDGPKPDELQLRIAMPSGATANHLAIASTVANGPRTSSSFAEEQSSLATTTWYPAELMESQEAARKYQRLTGLGLARLKDPAILYWLGSDLLQLQVFPLVAGKTTWIEIRSIVPTALVDGHYQIVVPLPHPRQNNNSGDDDDTDTDTGALDDDNAALLAPVDLRVSSIDAVFDARTLQLNHKPFAPGERFVRTVSSTQHRDATLRIAVRAPFHVRGRFARVPLATDREAVRVEIDVGSLSETPHDARVVLVIDASHSVGDIGLARQLAAARALVSLMPDARFEVMTFARVPRRRSTAFVSATATDALLLSLAHAPLQNGSELARAVHAAAQLLDVDGARAKRVVAFCDGNVRGTSSAGELDSALSDRPSVLLHVVTIERADSSDDDRQDLASVQQLLPSTSLMELSRVQRRRELGTQLRVVDEPLWSPAVNAHGGIVAALTSWWFRGDTLRTELTHLVRPTRLTDVRIVRAPSDAHLDRMSEDDAANALQLADLKEGASLSRSVGIDINEVTPVVAARLWATPMTFTLAQDAGFQSVAGGIMVADVDTDWTPFEMMRLATASHVVSPVTSLIAVEPGTRPSRDGLGGIGGGGGGGGGMDSSGVVRRGTSTMIVTSWDAILQTERAACLRAHPTSVETTVFFVLQRGFDEIVDVQPIVNPGTAPSALATCWLDALWDHTLSGTEPPQDIVSLSTRP